MKPQGNVVDDKPVPSFDFECASLSPTSTRSTLLMEGVSVDPNSKLYPDTLTTPRSKSSVTAPNTPNSPQESMLTIEHKHTTSSSNNKRSIFSSAISLLGKKQFLMIAGLGVYAIMATVAGSYFFDEFRSIPGYLNMIDNLEAQVTQLSGEVDRLGGEVDRLGEEVDQLSEQNKKFAINNENFKEENDKFSELNKALNETNVDFARLNDELRESNQEFKLLNEEFNADLDIFKVYINDLTKNVGNLEEQNETFRDILATLDAINSNMNQTAEELKRQLEKEQAYIDSLQKVNEDLLVVVSFLNKTAGNFDQSFEELVTFIANQISAYQTQVIANVQLTYDNKVDSWRCSLNDAYGADIWVRNPLISIGDTSYGNVMSYLDENLLSELCLDRNDFERYLMQVQFTDLENVSDISLSQLTSGVRLYHLKVEDFYFPDGTNYPNNYITEDEWSATGFKCEGLPRSFSYFEQNLFSL